MTYIYLDESGDLGFNEKSSKYFVLSCVKIDDDDTWKKFGRIPRYVRERTLNKKSKKQAELKFSNSSLLIRERFLTRVAKLPVDIYAVIINKKCTDKKLQERLPILYNYLIKILLEKAFNSIDRKKELLVCIDRCMSLSQRENFENYVSTEFYYIFQELPRITITHESSIHNDHLQVIDFICGAFGYKYNTANLSGDSEVYLEIIRNNIQVEKTDLFKENKRTTLTCPELSPEPSSVQRDLLANENNNQEVYKGSD